MGTFILIMIFALSFIRGWSRAMDTPAERLKKKEIEQQKRIADALEAANSRASRDESRANGE